MLFPKYTSNRSAQRLGGMVLLPFLLLVLTGCDENASSPAHNNTRQQVVKLTVTPPPDTEPSDTIHLVGNINQWHLTGSKAIELQREGGKFVAELKLNEAQQDWSAILFNLVRNEDWSQTAGSMEGKGNCGFIYHPKSLPHSLNIRFPGWTGTSTQDTPAPQIASSITGQVTFLKAFDMPQLQRTGDISIYLPPSYHQNPEQTYPVLYMLDGQNLFDNKSAYSVEWQIDEHITALTSVGMLPELIVVGMPNGPKRFNEYIPWDFIDFEGKKQQGQGDRTIQFIKNTLKPHIDSNFRTQPKAQHTGLAGSSLGGLMAIYGAIAYPDLFGFVGAFSPSLTVQNQAGEPALLSGVKAIEKLSDTRIYLDMGYVEYGGYKELHQLTAALVANGATNIKLVKDDLGRHCEQDWSKRFPYAITWMMGTR